MFVWIFSTTLIVLALWVMIRLERRTRASLDHVAGLLEGDQSIPLTIIKPVFGADEYTAENFRSWAEQDYDAPVEMIFSFQRQDDPGLQLAQEILEKQPGQAIVNPILEGYSGKMSNLTHGLEKAQYEWVIFSDSDIRAHPGTLRQLANLKHNGAALVSCLMRHLLADNLWGRIYAAFWNFEHMAFIAPSIMRYGREATGGTMAMTQKMLSRMGGLAAFKDYVAEDVAMGRKVRELGERVALGPMVDSPVGSMSLRALMDKFSRAALFSASMNEIGESLQYAILFSYLFVILGGAIFGNEILLGAGTILLLMRVGFASRFWQRTEDDPRIFFEIILSDIVFLAAFARALITRRLVWGGIQYRVTKGGKMVKVAD